MFVSLASVTKRIENKSPKELLEEKRKAKKEAARARNRNSNYAERKAYNLDWTRFPFPFNLFIMFSWCCDYVAKSSWFNTYILLCIGIAGLMVGLQTYPSFDGDPTLALLDNIILLSFSSEVVLKIFSDGFEPYMYFLGPEWTWNWFDFFIVVFSLPFIPFAAGQVKLLRLVRLMRLAKVFRKIPQLQMIIMGIVGGMKSCIYIVLLMIITFYLFAIMGVLFLKENDPWTFHSIEIAMLNLLRIATLDGWGDLLYISYYGCDIYPGNYYTSDPDLATNMLGGLTLCTPQAQPAMAVGYYLIIIVISSFCILSLFIGAISMSMAENMLAMRREKNAGNEEKEREKIELFLEEFKTPAKLDRKVWRSVELVKQAFKGLSMVDIKASIGGGFSLKNYYKKFSYKCQDLADWPPFQQFVTMIILLAGVLVGLGTTNYADIWASEIALLGDIVQYTFTFEVIVKVFSYELKPWNYFTDSWNIFDFIVVAASFLPIGGGSAITILRLLRLLRVLKLMRALKQLQVIVSALMSGISSIGFIFAILMLAYYFFGIVAMTLFSSNDKWRFTTLHMAMVTLFASATLDGWSDVLWTSAYGCVAFPGPYVEECTHDNPQFALAAIFWIIFIIFGSLVLLTLFIGVVGIGMEEAKRDQADEAKIVRKAEIVAQKEKLDPDQVSLYREVFDFIDIGGSNRIGRDEMTFGLGIAEIILESVDFDELWGKVDRDGSNSIDFSEFLVLMVDLAAQFTTVVDPVTGKALRKRNTYSFGAKSSTADENTVDGESKIETIAEDGGGEAPEGTWKSSKDRDRGGEGDKTGAKLKVVTSDEIMEGDDVDVNNVMKPISAKSSNNLVGVDRNSDLINQNNLHGPDLSIRDLMDGVSPQKQGQMNQSGTFPGTFPGMFGQTPFGVWPAMPPGSGSGNPETDVAMSAVQMQQMQLMMMPFLNMMIQQQMSMSGEKKDGSPSKSLANPFMPMLALSKMRNTNDTSNTSNPASPEKQAGGGADGIDNGNSANPKLKRKPVKSKVMSI